MNRMGLQIPSGAASNDQASSEEAGARSRQSLGEILAPRFRRDTVAVSAALFFCLLAGNIGVQIIAATRYSEGLGAAGTFVYSLSGIVGAIVGALAIERGGSRSTMLVMSGTAAVAALVIAASEIDPTQGSGGIATFSIAGMLILGLQTSLYTLVVNVYPIGLRGIGVGTVLAVGRLGAVAATYVVTLVLDAPGTRGFFFSWAIAMAVMFVALLLVQRHVLPSAAAFNYLSRRIQRGEPPATARQFEPKVTIPAIDVPLPPDPLLSAIRSGECVVVLGSGMSAQAGLPTWSALVDQVIHEALDPAQIPQFEKLRENRSIDDVVDALRAQLPASDITRRIVDEIASHTSPDMTTYSILSGLQLSGVVTLNVDDLAKRAFEKRGTAFVARQSERCLDAMSRNEFFVFMLNGEIGTPQEILLSHQNVKDAVSRNDAFRDLLRRTYYSRSLLFIGVSLSGIENFLRAIDRTAEPSRNHHALVEVADSTWEPVSRNLESQFRLKVLPFTPHHRQGAIDRFVRAIDSRLGIASPVLPATTKASRITHVELRNIGPFSECNIELDEHWTVILGDNGVGKSSVLKAIAVGLCGKASEPFAERLLKSRTTSGEIKIRLGGRDFLTTIARKSGGGVIVQSESGVPLERESVLAVGYPALRTVGGRRAKAGESTSQRPNPSDLLPLTSEEPDPRLDNIKQWIVRLDHLKSSKNTPGADRERYSALYDRIFTILAALTAGVALKPGGVNPNTGEITIDTKDGPIPFESLSQGTLSLIGWTGALMQRLYETVPDGADPLVSPVIVLVDEIDAHMHPAWQQALVKRLSEMFTGAQFIVTSHSPLVVGGLEANQVYRFERDSAGVVQISQPDHSLKGMGAAGLLTSDLFGLTSHLDIDTADALDKKRQLTARRLEEGLTPGERDAIDRQIEELEKKVHHVDATRFVRDPLYPVFVAAMSQVESGARNEAATVTLTADQKRDRARLAEAVVRQIKQRQKDAV